MSILRAVVEWVQHAMTSHRYPCRSARSNDPFPRIGCQLHPLSLPECRSYVTLSIEPVSAPSCCATGVKRITGCAVTGVSQAHTSEMNVNLFR